MLDREFEFFKAHQDEFVREHPGEYVVIKGEAVLGFYPDAQTAYFATAESHEPGTFLIQEVRPGQEAYTQTFHSRVLLDA